MRIARADPCNPDPCNPDPCNRFSRARALLVAAALVLLLALTGASFAVTAPARAAAPGVVLANTAQPQLADLRALGTHWVRVFASWPYLEPTRGGFSAAWLASYDHLFAELPRGTKVLVDVVDTPSWESGSSDEHAPPANPGDYAAFIGALAQRWAGRVAAYEIWNEEDSPAWWSGAPDPAGYTRLLQAAYPAVKAADSGATVVLGGLTGNDYPFLEGVYAAGGRGSFDAVGVHTDTACDVNSPYDFLRDPGGRLDPDSFLAYREVRAVMLAHADPKPIWMTELSWRASSASCHEGAFAGRKPEGVGQAQQARYLAQAYHCLAQDPYVQVALWFPLQDDALSSAGLVRADGSRKPAFGAMRRYARHGDRLREACGDFSGPAIRIGTPRTRTRYSGPLLIHVSARSSAGVGRITLQIDGKLIRNYTSRAFPRLLAGTLDWQGARRIAYGRHTLTFIAINKLRNVSRRSITIYHLRARGHH